MLLNNKQNRFYITFLCNIALMKNEALNITILTPPPTTYRMRRFVR